MNKFKFNYDYENLKDGERQYNDYNFGKTKVVDARYVHAEFSMDKGNPLIEALPLPRSDVEILHAYNEPLSDFDRNEIMGWSKEKKKRSVSMLRNFRITLPFHYDLEEQFYSALVNSYRSRYFTYNDRALINTTINQEKVVLHNRLIGEDGDSTFSGFALLGYSGCGKSSAIKILLNHYPQVIYHHPRGIERFPQILYLVVNCTPNSNFSSLYVNIGDAIDKALGNVKGIYKTMIKKIKTLGGKADKIKELVEIFNIGIILFDEIQLINFESTKEDSFESLMVLSNRTKVAIGVIGTEDAYQKMFKILRSARRTGVLINADKYCSNYKFFEYAVKQLFNYQWYDEEIVLTRGIIDSLYKYTKGIIDQLIGIYMFMQIDYLRNNKRPIVNEEFIKKVVNSHYKGIQSLLEDINYNSNSESYRKIIATANDEMINIFSSKQNESIDFIVCNNSVNNIMKRNVLYNILSCHDEYTNDEIFEAYEKVINIKENKNKTEKELSVLTVKMLINSSLPKEKPKKIKKLSNDVIEKFIEESNL